MVKGAFRRARRRRAASLHGPITGVVVRERGRWTSAPVDAPTVHPLAGAQVAAMGAAAGHEPAAPLEPHTWIEAVPSLALAVVDGVLGVVPPGGDDVRPLDRACLLVLDALVERASCRDLAERAGLDPAAATRAAAALVELGCAGLVDAAVDAARAARAAQAEPAAASAPRDPLVPYLGACSNDETPRPLGTGPLSPLDPDRIPVIAVHQPRFGPPLALGMILSYARTWASGRLTDAYEIRPLVTIDEARLLLRDHRGPGVVLCSDYVWSYEANMELAEEVAVSHPELVVVHGGPHSPRYAEDQERFFARPGVDVAVVGEGEQTAVEVLDALLRAPSFGDLSPLGDVPGVVFRDERTGELVRTADRDRIADLDVLPSPYLTGEFDSLHPASWAAPALGGMIVTETNRGCPYRCTFCDWGSATMSRIRKFSMDRVIDELEWLAARGLDVWMVADANFGILPRDVEIAERIADIRRRTGVPSCWGVNTAKNATRNLTRIIETLCDANVSAVSSLALQTRDERTLEVIDRSNIGSDRYDELALAFRRKRLPIQCDLILGLPGSTVETFKADLQWAFDHEITPRVWACHVLPNAPMNAPEYRAEHGLVLDDEDVVVASATFTAEEREQMMDLRMGERTFEHLGLLRHVLRYLQWDLGLRAVDVLEAVVRAAHGAPARYPLVSWVLNHMDVFFMPPVGWGPFYAEVASLLDAELGVSRTAELDTVLRVQRACMPDRGRSYPDRVDLPHDYVAYHRDATADLRRRGRPTAPTRRLASYPPGTFEVWGDPARLAETGFVRLREERPSILESGGFWNVSHLELDSPLTRWVAEVRASSGYTVQPDEDVDELDLADPGSGRVAVAVGPPRRRA